MACEAEERSMLVGPAAALLALPAVANAAVTANGERRRADRHGRRRRRDHDHLRREPGARSTATIPPGDATCNAITAIDVNGGAGANAITLTGVTTAAFPRVAAVDDRRRRRQRHDHRQRASSTSCTAARATTASIGDDNAAGTRDVFDGERGQRHARLEPGRGRRHRWTAATAPTRSRSTAAAAPSSSPSSRRRRAGRVQFDRTGPSPTPVRSTSTSARPSGST